MLSTVRTVIERATDAALPQEAALIAVKCPLAIGRVSQGAGSQRAGNVSSSGGAGGQSVLPYEHITFPAARFGSSSCLNRYDRRVPVGRARSQASFALLRASAAVAWGGAPNGNPLEESIPSRSRRETPRHWRRRQSHAGCSPLDASVARGRQRSASPSARAEGRTERPPLRISCIAGEKFDSSGGTP